jgi:hypothetical protein
LGRPTTTNPHLHVPRYGLRNLHAVIVLLMMAAGTLTAQRNVLDSDPLRARVLLVYDQVGVFGGLSNNAQGGTFTTACDCAFTGGGGTALTGGVIYERLTRSRLTWGAMLAYENRSMEARFQEIEGLVQRSPTTGREYNVPVTFRNIGETSLSYFTLTPFIKYDIFDAILLRIGPALSYIVSSNITHTKQLVSETVTLPGGEVATVRLPGQEGTSVVLENGPVPQLNSLQISASAAVGAEIRLSKKVFLSPLIQYVQPFTTISGRGDGFTVRSLQLLVEARMIL